MTRVLPRYWDGHRLLRFLAGLAMLALAFTAPAFAGTSTPVPVPESVAVREVSPEPVTQSESVPAPSAVRVVAAPRPAEILAVRLAGAAVAVLSGRAVRAPGERAPPAA